MVTGIWDYSDAHDEGSPKSCVCPMPHNVRACPHSVVISTTQTRLRCFAHWAHVQIVLWRSNLRIGLSRNTCSGAGHSTSFVSTNGHNDLSPQIANSQQTAWAIASQFDLQMLFGPLTLHLLTAIFWQADLLAFWMRNKNSI